MNKNLRNARKTLGKERDCSQSSWCSMATYTFYLLGLSVESKGEGIVVSSVEEGRLAHVQGRP